MIIKNIINRIIEFVVLFLIGGTTYFFIEIMWRGYSHMSMFVVGGVCFLLLGQINECLSWDMTLLRQSLIGAGIVTLIEFMSGVVLNVWLDLGVWDYSGVPFNVYGQICLLYTFFWIPLSAVGIILDDWIRYFLFGEERPHYKLI